ncbi:MAG: dipeptidase [Thermoprotei archaeon]
MLFDLHEDLSLYITTAREAIDLDKDGDRHADIPKYRASDTRVIVGAVFPARYLPDNNLSRTESFKNAFEEALNHILTYYKLVRKYGVFQLVEDSHSLEQLFSDKPKRIGIIIGLEGAYPVREPDDLYLFHKLGVRVLGLTWNVDNKYAASCFTKKDYGLTGLGSQLVDLALDLGMVIDLAHASKNTMKDVLSITEKPVIISHTGLRRYRDSPRNIDDEILDLLKSRKGVVGIFFVAELLGEREVTVDTVADQILYIKENYGVDIIGIGTDYFGTSKLPRGLEHIGLINNLAKKLRERGFTEEEIEKVFYRNALRVFLENLS